MSVISEKSMKDLARVLCGSADENDLNESRTLKIKSSPNSSANVLFSIFESRSRQPHEILDHDVVLLMGCEMKSDFNESELKNLKMKISKHKFGGRIYALAEAYKHGCFVSTDPSLILAELKKIGKTVGEVKTFICENEKIIKEIKESVRLFGISEDNEEVGSADIKLSDLYGISTYSSSDIFEDLGIEGISWTAISGNLDSSK